MLENEPTASVVCASPDVLDCTLAEGSALLHQKTGVYFMLNETGAFIWDAMRTPISVDDLGERLSAHYSIDPDTAAQDVRLLVAQMQKADLITVAEPRRQGEG